MIRKFVDNIDEIAGQRASVAEEARQFTEAILRAAHTVLPEARRIPRRLGWCERPAVRAALLATLDKKRDARRQCKTEHTTATRKALRAACKEVQAAIDKGIEVLLEEYVADLETLLRHRDMRGLYKHRKMTAGLGGRKTEGSRPSRTTTAICCEIRGISSGGGSRSTIGGVKDTTIPSPGWSSKQPLPGIGLHDPLHGRLACPEFTSFHQRVGQICPREGLFRAVPS